MPRSAIALFVLAWIAHAGAAAPPANVTRTEAMATAESYRTIEWIPAAANVLHGPAADHIRVDTPDAGYRSKAGFTGWWKPGMVNTGMPYQWGGFDTPETFLAGIVAGKGAGDVCTPEKRRLLEAAVSKHAVGIDCSGFVSRCWNLPRAYSTRTLTTLCEQIKFSELKPGDILNAPNSHVFLFKEWSRPDRSRMLVYTTGTPPIWAVQVGPLRTKEMAPLGYTAWRYRGMRD
jgi:cell wall-associated NlpC family hydrolase